MTLIDNKQLCFDEFDKLDTYEKEILVKWIQNNFAKRKTINSNTSSYTLKHYFEKDKSGFYITNNQFKAAMLYCDYNVKNTNDINWYFNVSIKKFNKKGES